MNGSDQKNKKESLDPQATIPMENARWERVGELVAQAMKLSPEKRSKFLDRIAFETPEIRREVEILINNADEPDTADFDDSGIFLNQIISHYKITGKLGEGGMGVVYKASDLRLEREAALKFLPRRYNSKPEMKRRFVQEAKAAALLDHPNICVVFEVGETEDGRLFIAMPFYDGETLNQKIERGNLPAGEAVNYALQIAEGLAHAHQAGIVHRDIKPENIMITPAGQVKILDFGVARIADTNLTKAGMVLGTVSYMSPEQASGEAADHRTDLWSLGLVLYEMLTGRQPFRADEIAAMVSSILFKNPAPVSFYAENIPPEFEKIVVKALRKKKSERYQTAEEIAADLNMFKRSADAMLPLSSQFFYYASQEKTLEAETPNNLSAELTSLIGREREMAEVTKLLRRSDVRMVTLTGIGGTGKTRLSKKIAREMLVDFSDGVYFIELAAITNPELAAPAIAQVLDVKEAGSVAVEDSLKNFLRDKKMLLVLDNFEQIIEAAPIVIELLEFAPS